MADLKRLLDTVRNELQSVDHPGKVADYIPELAKIDPKKFAISITNLKGETVSTGDDVKPFSIQSISKVFGLALALGKVGDALWKRVGREPSGSAFNSIVQLEHEQGIPRNPFINSGAIVVADVLLAGHRPREAIAEILRFVRIAANDDTIMIDPAVARSEQATGFRNFALANYMRAFGNLNHPSELTLGVYFHQCAIEMTARQLSEAGVFLANGGRDPRSGFEGTRPPHQRADADLRPLRRLRRLRISRRPAGQERSGWRNIGNCSGRGIHRRLVTRAQRAGKLIARHARIGTHRSRNRMVGVLIGDARASRCAPCTERHRVADARCVPYSRFTFESRNEIDLE